MNELGNALTSINYAEIIASAASSSFGMFALIVILMSLIAIAMFWKSHDRYRIIAFIFVFVGLLSFGKSVTDEKKILIAERERIRLMELEKQSRAEEFERQMRIKAAEKEERIRLETLARQQREEELRQQEIRERKQKEEEARQQEIRERKQKEEEARQQEIRERKQEERRRQAEIKKQKRDEQIEYGGYCCDFFGYRRCELIVEGRIGYQCFCAGQGNGIICR
ncbi:hypothetical protein ACJO1Z_22790 [Vibrio parahaemolyticus]|uniref:hypothetical protein n=1 Tax=Vibrio parahaemolyticus TaxID=670 RepID=UPI00387B656E